MTKEKTPEQEARDMLERLSDCAQYTDPQAMSSGDIVELANLIRELRMLRRAAPEPTEDARSVGHAIRQCILRKEPISDALALSAVSYLDPPEPSEGPWCDNCGQDEDAHVGPELKCPSVNRGGE